MANKKVGVDIAFNADTSKAKASIQELQTLLNKITYSGASGSGSKNQMAEQLQSASAAAKELQYHLNNAFNAKTGKLDLSLLDKSLASTNSDITKLSTNLLSAGTTGQQAFVKVAQAIAQAEQPMVRVNDKIKDFAVSLKNAAKYQLSNAIIQGFTTSLNAAVGYAKDLNSSLNEIRIVSGKGADEMARFAEEANKSAKRLSTTTTDYTKASLIYYQQGLSDQEVADRTETTIKMANVAGTSAQKVSDQMTAVWNNFYDGSKSLEYYSDVMVKLGAATASSTDEISTGVNKFAATAKTVGLSYEYAASALATVTARTRESADVVGNAMKTLFARIQGLNLGETLDDGTTLNKYSKALEAVGIDIKTQSGDLKDMDDILDELGEKWGTISRDQQTALAQTVAGVRQYSQLMALMNNWDYFKENLQVAYGSEGELEAQAEIYAESWEAAEKRVKASMQGVYQAILDDKFFISLNNGFANALGGLEAFIEGAGGVGTIITGISSIIVGAFAHKIPDALQTAKYNFDVLTKGTEVAYKKIQKQMEDATQTAFDEYKTTAGQNGISEDSISGTELKYANQLLNARNKLAQVSDRMSSAEKQRYETSLSLIEAQQKETIALQEQNDELERSIELQTDEMLGGAQKYYDVNYDTLADKATGNFGAKKSKYESQGASFLRANDPTRFYQAMGKIDEYERADEYFTDTMGVIETFEKQLNDAYDRINNILVNGIATPGERVKAQDLFDDDILETVVNLETELRNIANTGIDTEDKLNAMKSAISAISDVIPPALQEATGLSKVLSKMGKETSVDALLDDFEDLVECLAKAEIEGKDFEKVLKAFQKDKSVSNLSSDAKKLNKNIKDLEGSKKTVDSLMQSFNPQHVVRTTEALGALGSVLGSSVASFNSLVSIFKSWANPDLTGWEKVSATLTGLSSTIFSGINAWKQFGTVVEFLNQKVITSGLILESFSAKQKAEALILGLSEVARRNLTNQIGKENLAKALNIVFSGKETGATKKEIAQKIIESGLLDKIKDKKLQGVLASQLASLGYNAEEKSIWGVVRALIVKNALKLKEIAIIGLVVGAVVGGVALMVKAYNADAEAAKKASESAKQATEEYQNIKQAYDDLKSSLSSIDDSKKSLDKMTKGTDEWKNSVIELNNQILDLIDKYPALASAVKKVDGVLTIDKQSDAYKAFLQQQEDQVNFASQSRLGAIINSNQASEQDLMTRARRKVNSSIAGGNVSEELIDKVIKAYNDGAGKNVFDRSTLNSVLGYNGEGIQNEIVSAIIGAQDKIIDLADAVRENTAVNKIYGEQIASSYFANDSSYQNSENQEEINSAVSQAFENTDKSDWSENWNGENDKEVQLAYARLMGYQWVSNNKGTGTYMKADGTSVDIDDKVARYALNQKDWMDTYAPEIQTQVEDFFKGYAEETGKVSKEVIKAAITGDTSGLSEEDYNLVGNLSDLIDDAQLEKLKTLFGENIVYALQNIIDQEYTPESKEQFDLSTWKTQYNALQEAVKDSTKGDNIDADLYNQLGEEYQKYFEIQRDGTYALTISAKEFKNIVEGIKTDLLKGIDNKQGVISNIVQESGLTQNGVSNSITQWKASLENGENMSSQANSNLAKVLSDDLGIDKGESSDAEYIQNLINAYQALETELTTLQEGLGQVSNSVSELDGYLISGRITSEQYDKALNGVIKTEAEANDIDYSEIENYAETLQEVNEKLKGQEALSKKIALAEKKQAKGADDLKDNYKDYVKVLNKAKVDEKVKDTEEYSKTLNSLRKDLSLLTGVEEDVFRDEFINSDEVQKTLLDISNGVDGATEKLKVLATMEEIHLKIDDTDAWTRIQDLTDEIITLNQDDTIRIGATIDNSSALQGLEDLLYQSGLTTEQIQKIFNDLGWQPEMSYTEMTVAEANKVGTYTNKMVWVPDRDGLGWHQEKLTDSGIAGVDADTVIKVPTIGSKKGFTKLDPPGNGSVKKPPSSGGGKTAKHAEKKNDSDKERYHTILNQLEDLNSEYDDISKAKDRAFGKDRLKNMDEEIAKTDELIDKQKEYLNAIENYLPIDLAAMIGSYEDTIGGPNILFDEKGNISNFDEIQDAMFAKYNQMADAFDEDSTDWQIFEKKYEQLEKYIEQYEETYDLLRDQEQEYQDLINQRLDAQLEKVQYTVEVKLDVSEDQVKLLEYQLGRIEDDSFKSLEAIGLLTEKANELNKQIETNKQGLNDALNLSLSTAEIAQVMAGNLSVLTNKNFTDEQISAIKEYRDNILDLNGELDDLREEVESKLMDAFDAWQEKLEKGVDTLDHYGSILESYKNIIDIVGTDALGLNDEFMNDLAQGSVDNAINKLEAVKSEYRSIENARAEAEAKLKDAQDSGDTKSAEMWEQTLADLTEKSQEAQENMLSAWEDALDRLAEQFEQSAERIAESFNKSIYNLGGLEGLGNDFDKAQDRADIMLDDYQKIYELSKLSRDINKSIDDTDLIGGKEKLKKLLGDVNALQEDGVEMSQYDLEYLQKTYDLRLAELELEEAQRAKNTVRLSKDNEGNWSYIYTQNSDAVDQAQQKYEDALYAMQDLSSNYIDEMSEKLIDTSQEMAEALAELRIQDFASIDDYYAEVDRVQKYYQEQLDLQENELNKAILNNKTLYDEDWTAYHNATGYKISDTEDFVTAFKDSMLGTLMGSETDMSDFTEIIKGSLATMTEQLLQAADTYYRNLQEAMNAADTSIEDFGEDIGASIDEITAKSEEGASSVEDMADRMNTAVNDLMDTIQTWQESYGLAMEEIINDNLAVIESINELTKKLSLEDYDASVSWNLTRKDKDTPTGMASGGYTGSWGKEGKLGILHEKELVLNATDTANMLDMLQITRDMINTIDLQTQNAKLGFGELVASTIRDPLSEVLEQNVHITAEFPNVTDHNEIEQALLNLSNTASQYANRK